MKNLSEQSEEPIDAIASFEEFFSAKMQKQIAELAAVFPEKRSLEVDFAEIEKYNLSLAEGLLEESDAYLQAAEDAIAKMNVPVALPSVKKFVPHVRVYNLPEALQAQVQSLGSEHLDKLIRVDGVFSWVTGINPRMKKAAWQCLHCDNVMKLETDKYALKPPRACSAKDCGRQDFRLLESESEFVNVQRAQLQDLVENLRGNAPTSHVEVWMEDDIVNLVNPGDKVTLTGILRLKPVRDGKTRSSVYAKCFDVIHLQKKEQDFEALKISAEEEAAIIALSKDPLLYEKIVKSIAPSIWGYNEMKEAIALQLFGGTPNKFLPDGQRVRSDIHVLLIGDPGTAKSSLLSYVSRLAPKCIYVSGKSTSSVGLTAAAEKDEVGGGWILKAGAMVLASGGQVNVDELDKMDEEDRSAMHQAMEQQVISIAKAGIITQFNSQTAVLAAANPKMGRFDPNALPAQQFNISPTLLSRFDLIFPIRDALDETQDKKIAEHIIVGHRLAASKQKPESDSPVTPVIDLELLRKYVAYARKNVFPVLSPEAADKIKDFYIEMRRMGRQQNNFPITARYIEGIIRLAEASAKMRLSNTVQVIDAERAIALQKFVLREVFMDKETGRIDSDIINIGQPKSKIDKQRSLLGIISQLEKKFDLVSVDDVVKEAASLGIDEPSARRMVSELQRIGELYSPKTGYVKSATRNKEW
ncbi:MAG: minichromosome maintenance protein MCM [Candidatus Micrarchaeia archaeon]